MYSALFKVLPGPRWAKVIQLLVLASVVVALLVLYVFPYVNGDLLDPTISS